MDNMAVGNYIRNKLKEKGVSQEQLAERLNISPSAVSQNLNGKSSFEIQNLVIIAELLDDTLDNIVRAGERKETELEKKVKLGLSSLIDFAKSGQSIKDKDANGNTAIDYAISQGDIDIVKYLIDHNLYGDELICNPLFIALLVKHELIEYLNRQYAVHKSTLSIDSNLSWAKIEYPIFFKDRNQLHSIIQRGESIVERLSVQGLSLVNAILKCSNVQVLQTIPYFHQQRYGQINDETIILLAVAIEKDDVDALSRIKSLVRFEVDEKLTMFAIMHKCLAVTKFIIGNDRSGIQLTKIVESNDATFFSEFFNGSNINEHFLTQTLITAVSKGNQDIVKMILPKCSDKAKNTALDSINTNDMAMIRLLLDNGATFVYRESEGGNLVPMQSLTSVIKFLLGEKQKGK